MSRYSLWVQWFLLGSGATLLIGCSTQPAGRFAGHDGLIIAATFSRDGSRLASIGEDGTIRVWDVQSRKELARAKIQPPPRLYTVDEIAFSPDGAAIAFAASGNAVYRWLWQLTAPPNELFILSGLPSQVLFSPDGRHVLAASGGYGPAMTSTRPTKPVMQPLHIRVFDPEAGRVVMETRDNECGPISVAIAPDGLRFAVVCMTAGGRPVLDLPVSGEVRARLSIREIRTGRELVGINDAGNLLMKFSDDGTFLAAGRTVWDTRDGSRVCDVAGLACAFTDGSLYLLTLEHGHGVPWDLLLSLTPYIRPSRVNLKTGWESRGRRMVLEISGHSLPVPLRPPVSPHGRYIVDYHLTLWRLRF